MVKVNGFPPFILILTFLFGEKGSPQGFLFPSKESGTVEIEFLGVRSI